MRDDTLIRRGRGRPSVVPGVRSVACNLTLDQPLHRRLASLARRERIELAELIRGALREYSKEKLTASHS